ncbi:RNA polymerase Rpc34 subunit [Novymonas esmeraldas]|uniref:RNA polymerase Rpc34 subunit n=1 Tax=Novymonas esmeraldas TaxID=1808958 RepID=A0AAW0F0L7_9TRYP
MSLSSSMTVEQRILHRLSTSAEEAVPYEHLKRELQLGTSGGEGAVRQLMEQNRVRLRRGTGADTQIYISIVNNINENLSLVLDAVRASGSSGIDQAQLLSKVRMPKTEVGKALAALTAKNLIKEHRSFTNRAKRIYTLFNIDPSSHVTGGTMYCGEELDVAFVDEWRRELTRFVSTRRMVGFDQIRRHVEAVQSAGGGGGGGAVSASGQTSAGLAAAASSSPAVVTVIDSAVLRYGGGGGGAGGGGVSSAAGGGHALASAKQLSDADLRTLVHTLVLDGVLEMLIPATTEEVNTPQYQLACGQNVMRHFTAQARRSRPRPPSAGVDGAARQRTRLESDLAQNLATAPSSPLLAASAEVTMSGRGGVAGEAEGGGLCGSGGGGSGVMEVLRQSGLWEPAPISQPSARGAVDGWSYMPAVGFPCLGCPQLATCSASGRGVVNPTNCAYLKDWLS